jgi:hypothetical protein
VTAVVAFALIGFGVWLLLRKGRWEDTRRDARGGSALDGVGDGPAWSGGDCGGDGGSC